MTRNLQSFVHLAAMLVAGGVLLALSQAIFKAPCWSLIFIVAVVAWPIWTGQREYALFQHRLALVATTRESSRVRRWFWRGNLTSAMQLVFALAWAAVLLAFVPMLDPWHAGLLAADILVLTLAARYARSVLEDDVRQEYVELLSRRWVLMALNVAFLAVSFFAIDYFVVGAPDTRAVAWADVAERAYADFASRADCPLVGAIVGSLNAADSLAWHAAEVLIPSLPGPWLKLGAWLVFLLQASVIALGYTRLQLGVLALTQRRALRPPESGDVILKVLLPVIAAIYLLAAFSLRDFDPAAAARAGRTVVQWVNPCRAAAESLKALEGLKAELHTEIDAARKAEQQHGAAQIDATLNRLFLDVEAGVDNYLDWYFSLVGEYSRLAAWIGARSTDALQQDLQAELEKRLFGSANIRETLSQANKQLAAHAEATLGARAAQIGQRLGSQVHAEPCWAEALHLPAIPGIERDAHRAATALASGLGAGAAVGTAHGGPALERGGSSPGIPAGVPQGRGRGIAVCGEEGRLVPGHDGTRGDRLCARGTAGAAVRAGCRRDHVGRRRPDPDQGRRVPVSRRNAPGAPRCHAAAEGRAGARTAGGPRQAGRLDRRADAPVPGQGLHSGAAGNVNSPLPWERGRG